MDEERLTNHIKLMLEHSGPARVEMADYAHAYIVSVDVAARTVGILTFYQYSTTAWYPSYITRPVGDFYLYAQPGYTFRENSLAKKGK